MKYNITLDTGKKIKKFDGVIETTKKLLEKISREENWQIKVEEV